MWDSIPGFWDRDHDREGQLTGPPRCPLTINNFKCLNFNTKLVVLAETREDIKNTLVPYNYILYTIIYNIKNI